MEDQQNTPQEAPEQQPFIPPAPMMPVVAPKKSKKGLILTIVILLIVGGGAAAWFLLLKDKDNKTNTSQSSQQTEQEATKPDDTKEATVDLKPYAAFVTETPAGSVKSNFYLQPLDGSPRTKAGLPSDVTYLPYVEVYKNQIVVASGGNSETGEAPQILYSSDSGATFASMYKGNAGDSKKGDYGDQFTDIEFSNDGSAIVFGVLSMKAVNGASVSSNTTRSIGLSDKKVTDLFTESSHAGVFYAGYDVKAGKVYYRLGCFNCDGTPQSILYSYTIATKKTETLFDESKSSAGSAYDISLNTTATKLGLVKGSLNCEGVGTCAPYEVQQYDLATKATTKVAAIAKAETVFGGYDKSTGQFYYADGKALHVLAGDGKDTLVYTAPNTLTSVEMIDSDRILLSYYANNARFTEVYTVSTKKVTSMPTLANTSTLYDRVVWK